MSMLFSEGRLSLRLASQYLFFPLIISQHTSTVELLLVRLTCWLVHYPIVPYSQSAPEPRYPDPPILLHKCTVRLTDWLAYLLPAAQRRTFANVRPHRPMNTRTSNTHKDAEVPWRPTRIFNRYLSISSVASSRDNKPFRLQSAQYLLPGFFNSAFKMAECFSFKALSAVRAYLVDIFRKKVGKMKKWVPKRYLNQFYCVSFGKNGPRQKSGSISSTRSLGNHCIERSLNTWLLSKSFGNKTRCTISMAGIRYGHSSFRSRCSWLYIYYISLFLSLCVCLM